MESLFCCPVCGGSMKREASYLCESGHCFDIAKEGYVNLYMSKGKSAVSGDDKDMVKARTEFLSKGYYAPLKDEVCSIIKASGISNPVLFDSGCGEGYYTSFYSKTVNDMGGRVCGVDLSKTAIRHASKSVPDGEFAVASVYHLPIKNESVDIIVNCFSPLAIDEFTRIMKKDGLFIYIVPDAKHLWELKRVLYDNPYENEVKNETYNGFELQDVRTAKNTFTLTSIDEILSLFRMTPYSWKTSKGGEEKLKALSSLTVTAQFRILTYQKAGNAHAFL